MYFTQNKYFLKSCVDSNIFNFKLLPFVLLNSFNPNFGIIELSYLSVSILHFIPSSSQSWQF